jgi:hypothetical protein
MNRILVNKREVREAQLKHGDVVEIGRTRFLVQACVQADVESGARSSERPRRRAAAWAAAAVAVLAFGAWVMWRPAPPEPESATSGPLPELAQVAQVADAVPPESPTSDEPPPPAAPAAPPAALPDPATETVTEEIRQMRAQLDDIRATVKDMASKEAAPSATSLTYPVADPVRQKTDRLLEEARKAAEAGRFSEADQMLSSIQLLDPALLESYLQRALLFEKRGMLKKAVEQWSEIVQRSVGTPLYNRAVAERRRVAELDGERAASTGRLIGISSVEPHRFPESEEFDELRDLAITLQPEPTGQPIDPEAVRVEVTFYDEDPVSGRIEPSRFASSRDGLRIEGAWMQGDGRTVTATYAVPKGFRSGRAETFCGYTVKVFYHGILQDVDARPRNLLPDTGGAGEMGPGVTTNPPPSRASMSSATS